LYISQAYCSWRRLLTHAMDWLAALTLPEVTKSKAARIEMIAMTANNSIRVKAGLGGAMSFGTTIDLIPVFIGCLSPERPKEFSVLFLERVHCPPSISRAQKVESFKRLKKGYGMAGGCRQSQGCGKCRRCVAQPAASCLMKETRRGLRVLIEG